MDFTIRQHDLVQALTVISPAVRKKSTMPILQNVRITTSPEGANFAGTNLESFADFHVEGIVTDESASTTVNHKDLLAFAKKAGATEDIRLWLENNRLRIKCSSFTSSLETLDAKDFPAGGYHLESPTIGSILIERAAFARMVNFVAAGAAEEWTGRPVLTAILCEIENERLRMVSCDVFNLTIGEEPIDWQSGPWTSPLIPAQMLAEFVKKIPKERKLVSLFYNEKCASLAAGPLQIDITLQPGTFPKYRPLVEFTEKAQTRIVAPVKKWCSALETVRDAAKSCSSITKWKVGETVAVKAFPDGDEENAIEADLADAKTTGPGMSLAFNHSYLSRALVPFKDSWATLGLTTPLDSASITYTGLGLEGYRTIIAPMNLQK